MGQPTRRCGRVSLAEYIGMGSDTRGSETSQYPEEKKSTEIPLVAASERGPAQTGALAFRGCGTCIRRSATARGSSWNVARHRVKAPYPKVRTAPQVSQVGRNT